jgi:hypothetical protein
VSADRRVGQYLLPLAEKIRRDPNGSGKVSEGAGKRKRSIEETGGEVELDRAILWEAASGKS